MPFDFSLKKIATTSTWVFDLPSSFQSMNRQHLLHHHSTSHQIRWRPVRSSSIYLIQPFFRRMNSIGYVFFVSLISRVQVRVSHRCRSFFSYPSSSFYLKYMFSWMDDFQCVFVRFSNVLGDSKILQSKSTFDSTIAADDHDNECGNVEKKRNFHFLSKNHSKM